MLAHTHTAENHAACVRKRPLISDSAARCVRVSLSIVFLDHVELCIKEGVLLLRGTSVSQKSLRYPHMPTQAVRISPLVN